ILFPNLRIRQHDRFCAIRRLHTSIFGLLLRFNLDFANGGPLIPNFNEFRRSILVFRVQIDLTTLKSSPYIPPNLGSVVEESLRVIWCIRNVDFKERLTKFLPPIHHSPTDSDYVYMNLLRPDFMQRLHGLTTRLHRVRVVVLPKNPANARIVMCSARRIPARPDV